MEKLKSALESHDLNINIIITGSFELTGYAYISGGKTVTIISDGLAEHVISMNSAHNFQVRDGGNLILGDGSPLMLSGEVVGIINVVENGSIVVNDGVSIINETDVTSRYALHLSGSNVTGVINGGYFSGYVALDVRNGAKVTEIRKGEFVGETNAVVVSGDTSKVFKISGGVFWGKNSVAIKTETSILLEPGLNDSKGITRFSGKDGVIFNNDSLIVFPNGYVMSSQTEPVNNIAGTEFKYLERFIDGEGEKNVDFPCINISEPGVYYYTIGETSVSGNGWTTDTKKYPVVVTVTDDGNGKLSSHVNYPEGYPKFVNKYEHSSICIELGAVKIAVGAPLEDGQFTFAVFDADGNPVATATNRESGQVNP